MEKEIAITTLEQEIELFKRLADKENGITATNTMRVRRMYDKVKPLIKEGAGLKDLKNARSLILEYLQLLSFDHLRASKKTGTVPQFTKAAYQRYTEEVKESTAGFDRLLKRVEELIKEREAVHDIDDYNSLFEDQGKRKKITSYLKKHCNKDGLFMGLPEVDRKNTTQIKAVYEILFDERILKSEVRKDGNIGKSKKIFFEEFGFRFIERNDVSRNTNQPNTINAKDRSPFDRMEPDKAEYFYNELLTFIKDALRS